MRHFSLNSSISTLLLVMQDRDKRVDHPEPPGSSGWGPHDRNEDSGMLGHGLIRGLSRHRHEKQARHDSLVNLQCACCEHREPLGKPRKVKGPGKVMAHA